MCTYVLCMCNVFTCVCTRVCVRVLRICCDALRPTTFVPRARNVNVALSSSRETLIASERTSVRIASRPSVTHTREGDFGTYIINNRTTRRHDTITRRWWWNVRRDRATHTSWWACVRGVLLVCDSLFKHYGGASFTIRGFRGMEPF